MAGRYRGIRAHSIERKTISVSHKQQKKKPAAKPAADAIDSKLLRLALQAITELYPSDRTTPGLVLAWLPDKKQFYASFARYQDGQKLIVAAAYADTLSEVLPALVESWHGKTEGARAMLRLARSWRNPIKQIMDVSTQDDH